MDFFGKNYQYLTLLLKCLCDSVNISILVKNYTYWNKRRERRK